METLSYRLVVMFRKYPKAPISYSRIFKSYPKPETTHRFGQKVCRVLMPEELTTCSWLFIDIARLSEKGFLTTKAECYCLQSWIARKLIKNWIEVMQAVTNLTDVLNFVLIKQLDVVTGSRLEEKIYSISRVREVLITIMSAIFCGKLGFGSIS